MSVSGFPEGEGVFQQVLTPGVGYGVVVGVGFAFAGFMWILTTLQARFTRLNPHTANEFITASRSVKPGLICCGIVSAWTWSATLLQSSVGTYANGLSCAWWYGVGGTLQVAFFAAMAAKIKQNANGACTFPQIVRARYGKACHALMTFEAIATNHIVTGSLVLGCSATINALTGANIIAVNFLLPLGIAVYVLLGGLRATFLVDFLHTVILFVIIYFFLFTTYGSSDLIGSPGKMYDLLLEAAKLAPVDGNQDGSYVTMKSNSGMLFAASTIATGFSGVFLDQGYWSRAIASRPESTTRAYFLGGISWFAIPLAFGSVMGLGCRALMNDPSFPTYPYALSPAQVSAGLVAPAAAVTLLGKAGSVAMLIIVFMAATSAASAELIAVSSIFVFDIVGLVRKKPLTAHQSLRLSEFAIGGYALWAGCWSTILHVAGIDLGWLFYFQGVLLTPAVFPVACTVTWKKCSKAAVLGGTLIGTACSLTAWLLAAKKCYGDISIVNLALPYACVSGASAGLVTSIISTTVITLIRPDNYDWSGTRDINLPAEVDSTKSRIDETPIDEVDSGAQAGDKKDLETSSSEIIATPALVKDDEHDEKASETDGEPPLDLKELDRVFKRASWWSAALAVVITFIIPLPLFFSHYIFSRRFFECWIGIGICWVLLAGGFCIILPVYESRREMFLIARAAVRALSGRGSSKNVVA